MPVLTLPALLPGVTTIPASTTIPVGPANPAGTYTAIIGGVAVNVIVGTLSVKNEIGQRSQGSMQVWGPLGVIWQYGTQVQVFDDTGALAYAGYVSKDKAHKAAGSRLGTGYLEHNVQLMDNCYRADKRRVFKAYLLQTAGFIVRDLLGAYLAAEGVIATATSIATGPLITEARWSGSKNVGEVLTWLATQAGFWWQIDLHGVLWFQPYGGTPAPFVMDGTMADSMEELDVEYGNDVYINTQYAKGSYAETKQLTETFHGDGVKRNFTLSYGVSTVASVVLNSVDVTAQSLKKGSSGGQFYYLQGDPVVAQDPAQTILTSGDTLSVTYKGRYPVLAKAQNPALVAAQRAREGGGSGLVESTYTNTKVRSLSAAQQIAASLLAHYGQDTTILTFATRQKGLLPGQMLSVQLPDFALSNRQMLISAVEITDQVDGINVYFRVTAVGSPVESAQWQSYWQSLMSQSSDPSDYTDAADTSLALLSLSTVTRTPTVTVTQRKLTCPIIGPSLLCGPSVIVC